ncbi:MAG TPA: hypothetical protein VN345_07145 [Blastocatellia bacterium]|jgi:hypothetical protein|nr:hypothetical protein [Blastocatellia bacterium]
MKIKLALAACLMLLLPAAFNGARNSASPYATTALAGRTGLGGWCACGTEACICDPGEVPTTRSVVTHKTAPASRDKSSRPGMALVAVQLAIALSMWLGMRL